MALIVLKIDVAMLVNLLPKLETVISTSNAWQQAERERIPFVYSLELSVLGIAEDRFVSGDFH